ncbi:class I histocompatibility antigen, F10 alpha chain-like, partial [Chiloscyllium plagiosum]|uniref:class I histocompatibility antigen, F10 alpha chain-like n=1 Tax=Chiloscyllium plagiosum TaxID=36176 RepID=UPI001CB88AC9
MKEFPEVTSTATVNGVIIASRDNKTQQCIPRQQFLADFFDMNFWDHVTEIVNRHANMAKEILSTIMKRTNQTSGSTEFNTAFGKWLNQCPVQLQHDIPTPVLNPLTYKRFGFDGEDFISLDPDRMRWITSNPIAVMTKEKWDSDDSWNNYWKRHLEDAYIENLNTYLKAGKEYFTRKENLKSNWLHSQLGSLIASMVILLAVIVGIVGIIIWKWSRRDSSNGTYTTAPSKWLRGQSVGNDGEGNGRCRVDSLQYGNRPFSSTSPRRP